MAADADKTREELLLEIASLRAQVRESGSEAHRRAAERQALLSDASVLLTDSLDYSMTLAGVARLLVPRLCDWCTIYALGLDDESYRMVEAIHADPAQTMLLRQARQHVEPAYYESSEVWQRLRAGQSFLHSDLSEQELRALARDERWFHLLRDVLRCRSWMLVPLRCRGRMLGTLGLATGPSGRRYGPEDLALCEELALRVALALDNARLYQRAQEALAARDEFMALASHELRTPLTTLHLQVELLRRDLSEADRGRQHIDPARRAQLLSSMDRQTRRLVKLLKNLFDVARIHAGRLELHLQDVDLAELCRGAAARLEPEARQAGCTLLLSTEPAVGRWDRVQLTQLVGHLLGNAIQYGPGAPIELSVTAGQAGARLQVRDHGPGIPDQQQRRIFDRFDRMDARPARQEPQAGGLGLGLYIVKGIAAAHGGTVAVRSDPGDGATFTVDLPYRSTAAATAARLAARASGRSHAT